jgi:hypothetical protein
MPSRTAGTVYRAALRTPPPAPRADPRGRRDQAGRSSEFAQIRRLPLGRTIQCTNPRCIHA